MRKNTDTSPKVVAVYEAVHRLICDGQDISQLIVADIAREAGIGKGTIYEYFESKEEIIARALFYELDVIMTETMNVLSHAATVEDCFILLAGMMDEGSSLGTFFELGKNLVSNAPDVARTIQGGGRACELCQKYIDQLVDVFWEKLEKEGFIREVTDRDYIHFLILGMLQMVMFPGYTPSKRRQMVKYSVQTIKKALG